MKYKKLGQYFLINNIYAKKIVTAANIKNNDTILEIGSGNGILTNIIMQYTFHKFIVIEIDKYLYKKTKKIINYYNSSNKTKIICDDIKNFNFNHYKNIKIITNLPFYLSKWFLKTIIFYKSITLTICMLQKELVKDIIKNKYNGVNTYIGALINTFFKINIVISVNKYHFYPIPPIDTIVLEMKRIKPNPKINNIKEYENKLMDIFKNKRKKIKNKQYNELIQKLLNTANILRPHQIPINVLINILNI